MYIFCCFILRLAYSFSSFPNVVFFWPFHFETGISSLQFSYISNETENRTNNENRYLSPFYTIILILHHYWWHANFRNIPQKTNLSLRTPILGDRFLRGRLFYFFWKSQSKTTNIQSSQSIIGETSKHDYSGNGNFLVSWKRHHWW